jgi:hypothetical protein
MWMYILGTIVLVVVVVVVWGLLHLRHSQKVAYQAIDAVVLGDIDRLRAECVQVFREKFSESLDIDDLDASARTLSARLDNPESLKKAFAKETFYWYFVLPVGAYLGELLRVHAGAQWKQSEQGGLEMSVPVTGDSATTYPFHKVMKQVTMGDQGDLYAYLKTSTQLGTLLAGKPGSENRTV